MPRTFKYVADFETTTDKDGSVRVWLWTATNVDVPENWEYGKDIESFFKWCLKKRGTIYFHNLKFDGSYILVYLLLGGYEHTTNRAPYPSSFTTLIDDTGKYYQIVVNFGKDRIVRFNDSLKKIPLSVSEIAKVYKLDEGKGIIDYDKHRPIGYAPTEEEIDYARRDVQIVAHALKVVLDSGMTGMTVAGDSLKEYKRLSSKLYRPLFPVLSPEIDEVIRQAYRGGWVMVREDRAKVIHDGPGSVWDYNSLYPSVMYDSLMPYGSPVFSDTPETIDGYPLSIYGWKVVGKLKENHLPVIQKRHSSHFIQSEYVKEIKEPTVLFGTNVDWNLWNDHYDLELIEYEGGYHFMGQTGMFNGYIDKWTSVKERSTGGERFVAKLHLNSLYGKFGSAIMLRSKIPYLNEDSVLSFKTTEPTTRPPVYLPVAIFTTAYGRNKIVRLSQRNYDRFLYSDTDSIHLFGTDPPEGETVDDSRMGALAHEYDWARARFIRAKQYGEEMENGKTVVHIAGLPQAVAQSLTVDHLVDGAVFHGKLVPVRVPGGTRLVDSTFSLKF